MVTVITVDGPAASGKSSLSRLLAKRLNWNWVSTGAFYRGLAYVAYEMSVSSQNESALVALALDPIWKVELAAEQTQVKYDNRDVTAQIGHEDIGSYASVISRYPGVRAALLEAQRACAQGGVGLVAEGRDCGTVVFPQAPVKFFLTANSEDRALRRALEQGLSVESTAQAQKQRDEQDRTRQAAPLQVPAGAHVIDTSQYNLGQVAEMAYHIAKQTFHS
jgi:cytidylate kinase